MGLPWKTITCVLALSVAAYFVPPSLHAPPDAETWLFFDGVCNLCDGFVNFVADGDSSGRVKFGALQRHKELLVKHGAQRYAEGGEEALTTVVVIQAGNIYVRSEAALRVLAQMDQPWRSLSLFHILPVFLRDEAYKLVARNRYWVFGKADNCRVPTERFKARFLDYVPSAPKMPFQ